jgi:hypothetical protein
MMRGITEICAMIATKSATKAVIFFKNLLHPDLPDTSSLAKNGLIMLGNIQVALITIIPRAASISPKYLNTR